MSPPAERWAKITEALDQHWQQLQDIKVNFEQASQVISALTVRVIQLESQLGDLVDTVITVATVLNENRNPPQPPPKKP